MALQVYAAGRIVRTLIDAFLPARQLRQVARGLAPGDPVRQFHEDEVLNDMEQFAYVRIDALRAAQTEMPLVRRDWVVILVLSAEGKYSHFSPDLRKLLEGVALERAAKDGRLDEVIVVAEEAFFAKNNLTSVLAKLNSADGSSLRYTAYPYYTFSYVLPACASIPPHRLLSDSEVADLLANEHLALGDLPVIFTTDPPIVWNGGREGQVVEITRDSQTAGQAIYYRRIVHSVH